MPCLVFVFGTLKEGFPNFQVNRGSRVPGVFATREKFLLYLVGERFTPWMIDDPGCGECVVGQVFRVDDSALEQMDLLERTAELDGYQRRLIAVATVSPPGSPPVDAYAYLKEPSQLESAEIRLGPLFEYTPEHAALYKPRPGVLLRKL